jgi:hypothetical protein
MPLRRPDLFVILDERDVVSLVGRHFTGCNGILPYTIQNFFMIFFQSDYARLASIPFAAP